VMGGHTRKPVADLNPHTGDCRGHLSRCGFAGVCHEASNPEDARAGRECDRRMVSIGGRSFGHDWFPANRRILPAPPILVGFF
jgi:hypothetical protein